MKYWFIIIHTLVFVLTSSISTYAHGFPEREIVIGRDMPGIALLISSGKLSKPPDNVIYPSRDASRIHLNVNDYIDLQLSDNPAENGEKYSVRDLEYLANQSRHAFQSISIIRSSFATKLSDTLKCLNNQTSLENAVFYACDISSDSVMQLSHINSLRSITFRNCVFEYSTLVALRKSKITNISLFSGTPLRPLSDLSNMPTLRELYLENINIENRDIVRVKENTSVTTLTMNRIILPGDADLENLSKLRALKHLQIAVKRGRVTNFVFLEHLSKLRSLSLAYSGLTEKDVHYIGNISELEYLEIASHKDILSNNINEINKLKKLRLLIAVGMEIPEDTLNRLKQINAKLEIIQKEE